MGWRKPNALHYLPEPAPHGRGLRGDVEAAGSLRAAREGSERALRGRASKPPRRRAGTSTPPSQDSGTYRRSGREGARLEGERGGGNQDSGGQRRGVRAWRPGEPPEPSPPDGKREREKRAEKRKSLLRQKKKKKRLRKSQAGPKRGGIQALNGSERRGGRCALGPHPVAL